MKLFKNIFNLFEGFEKLVVEICFYNQRRRKTGVIKQRWDNRKIVKIKI